MLTEPLSNDAAGKLIRQIAATGNVMYLPHFVKAMADDGLTMADCLNVMRAGWVESAEYENGAWRYRKRTNRLMVVVEFASETELVAVTTWRIGP
jgi:hypothetical protein